MKRVVVAVLVLFLGWAVVEAPDTLAALVTDGGSIAWDGLTTLFASVMEFLSNITS